MTYGELLEKLYGLTPKQLNLDVTVQFGDEYLPVGTLIVTKETDVLDAGHPYLTGLDYEDA